MKSRILKINNVLIPDLKCSIKNIIATKRIGRKSINGEVYMSNNPLYVIKYIKVDTKENLISYTNEVYVGSLLKKKQPKSPSYSVRVLCATKPEKAIEYGGGIIIMDNVARPGEKAMDLEEFLKRRKGLPFPDKIRFNLYDTIVKFWTTVRGYYLMHGDLHDENVFVILDKNGKFKQFRFIDFGSSILLKRKSTRKYTRFGNLWANVFSHFTSQKGVNTIVFTPKKEGKKYKIRKQSRKVYFSKRNTRNNRIILNFVLDPTAKYGFPKEPNINKLKDFTNVVNLKYNGNYKI